MHAYIGGICNNLQCQSVTVGGVEDHVHILCFLGRTITIADLLKEIKASSSKWIKTKGGILTKFAWQNGYGAFSVDRFGIPQVKKYIENQEAHHNRRTFKEEYRKFLVDHHVEFDEKYVWD